MSIHYIPDEPCLFDLDHPELLDRIGPAREGKLGGTTVPEIFLLRNQGKLELGGKSDGQLPKGLENPPGFVGKVYDWILSTSNCHQPLFALSAALMLTGTILGQKVKSSLGQYTNLFAMNVGKTSSGKDYPRQAILSILDAAGASHIWRAKVTSDSAIESALECQSNLLVTIDEAGHFFKTANARGNTHANTIKPTLLELWSSAGKIWKGKQRAQANGKPQKVIMVENPCVSFYGATQPEVFFGGITTDDIRDGWIPRNLFFFSRHQCRPEIKASSEIPADIVETVRRWTEEPEDAEMPTKDGETPAQRAKAPVEPIVVGITDKGLSRLKGFSNTCFRKVTSESAFAGLYGKVVENTIRVALILAVSQHIKNPKDAVITDDDITYAANLVYFLTMTMEDVFTANLAENGTERQNKRLLRLIKAAGHEGITTSILTGKSRWLSGSGRRKILDDLIESGDIKELPTQKGGSLFVAIAD